MFNMYDMLLTKENISAINGAAIDLLADCANVTFSGNNVTIKLDDSGAKKYIFCIIDMVYDMIDAS